MADCRDMRERLAAVELDAPARAELAAHVETCAACARSAARLASLDGALAELAEAPLPLPSFEGVRASAQSAARGRQRVRRFRRALPFAFAAAAGMATVALVSPTLRRVAPHVELARPPVVGTRVLAAGEPLEATSEPVQARLVDGAQLTVRQGHARVEASARHESSVRLDDGELAMNVPHLDEGAILLVRTDEAELRVHGTRFEVVRRDAATRVTVTEGSVEVQPYDVTQATFVLHRGETVLVEGNPAARARARNAALDALEHERGAQAEASVRAWLALAPPPDEAAEAYAILGWKQAADGDRAGALTSYRHALALLPAAASPLWADNALAQLALLVERDDRDQGAVLWRHYLERFPAGTHAPLARSRVGRPGPRP